MKFKEVLESYEIIVEKRTKKRMVRKGQVVKKWTTDREGYKIDAKTGKEVRMSPQEKLKRKKGQRKGKLKRKAKKSQISRSSKKSAKLRKSRGLK